MMECRRLTASYSLQWWIKWASKAGGSALTVYGKSSSRSDLVLFCSSQPRSVSLWFYHGPQSSHCKIQEEKKASCFTQFHKMHASTRFVPAHTREILQCHLFSGCLDKLHHHSKRQALFSFSTSAYQFSDKNAWRSLTSFLYFLLSPLSRNMLWLLVVKLVYW